MANALAKRCQTMASTDTDTDIAISPSIPPSPTSPRAKPDTERFAALIEVDESGCHLWRGTLANGQGYFKAGPWTHQRTKLAHRFAWELVHGPLAPTQQLVHTCGVRRCNLEHLALKTSLEKELASSTVDGWTEREILDLLIQRYTKISMGAHRFAFAEHVSDKPSWASRIADFIAIDCWMAQRPRLPLRYEIHGHEVKVSRSDWLKELRQPDKAEAFRPYCHRWWLVVSDRRIVLPGELPEGWGLLAKSGPRLITIAPAPLLDAEPMPVEMVATMLRATAKTARRAAPSDRRIGVA
jgi:hypothetical protein